MKWLRASLFAQAILALYFQAIQWLPLGDWNNQCPSGDEIACELGNQGLSIPGYQRLSVLALEGRLSVHDVLYCAAVTMPFWAFWFAYSTGLRWLMWMQVGFYSVLMALQIKSSWAPYVFGATDSQVQRHQRVFGHSTQLLPSFGRHLPPDGMHLERPSFSRKCFQKLHTRGTIRGSSQKGFCDARQSICLPRGGRAYVVPRV